ncbi:hypothetical protein AOLI_G00328970 [Acnodon oligacanthus]
MVFMSLFAAVRFTCTVLGSVLLLLGRKVLVMMSVSRLFLTLISTAYSIRHSERFKHPLSERSVEVYFIMLG